DPHLDLLSFPPRRSSDLAKVTDFLRMQRPPQYNDDVVSQPVVLGKGGVVAAEIDTNDEPVYRDAVQVVIDAGKASTSLLQRRLQIGRDTSELQSPCNFVC